MSRSSRSISFLGLLILLAGSAPAQTPKQQAWEILEAAAVNSKVEMRADNARALALVTANTKVVTMLEQALQDKDPSVRSAAATSLGVLKSKASVPKLLGALKDPDGDVVMAAAKALAVMDQEKGYSVFYALVTGERKSGEGLVGSEEKEMTEVLKNPSSLANEAFAEGMGFVPYGGVAMGAYNAIRANDKKEALVKAAAVKTLATDPDPRTRKALVQATTDKEWIVRAAAYDALARRGDATVVAEVVNGLIDSEDVVKLTAAAAIAQLSRK